MEHARTAHTRLRAALAALASTTLLAAVAAPALAQKTIQTGVGGGGSPRVR